MPDIESGIGLVYWPGLESLFEAGDLPITSLEVEVEAFWFQPSGQPRPYRLDYGALQRIAALPQTKVIHGVGACLGTCHPPSPDDLAALRESIAILDAKWYSGHLAFNRVHTVAGEYSTGFLLPPLQTTVGATAAAGHIRRVRKQLGVPLAVETGVNYLRRQPWELPDGEFTAQVCRLADCDLLLDLHNLWTNHYNNRESAETFLSRIDPARVREIHLAGGFEYQGYWLDAHSGLVPDEVLALARKVTPRLPKLRAIHIEILPQFIPSLDLDALRGQIRDVQRIWESRGSRVGEWFNQEPGEHPAVSVPATCTPERWEATLGALVAGKPFECDADWQTELASDPGIPLFTDLARTFRAGVVVEQLKMSSRYLMLSLEKEGFRRLLNDFWRAHTPEPFAAVECRAFAAWLRELELDLPYLHNLLDYDQALMDQEEDEQPRLVHFDCEPMGLLRALGAGTLPQQLKPGAYELELTPSARRTERSPEPELRAG